MRQSLDVGSSPWGESCAQVGSTDYYPRARRECRAYIHQLQRVFGPEPEGARLFVKTNPHDFGDYLSVACEFEAGNTAATDYAFRCENQQPELWDTQARAELELPKEVADGHMDWLQNPP
jgi:hypothetical protein